MCTYRADTYVLNALCALLSFKLFFGRYQFPVSGVQMTKNSIGN